MKYVETTTIVRTDEFGRVTRQRKTTCVKDNGRGIREITTTRFMTDDEYFSRKAYDHTPRSSMDRIFAAYNESRSADIWD